VGDTIVIAEELHFLAFHRYSNLTGIIDRISRHIYIYNSEQIIDVLLFLSGMFQRLTFWIFFSSDVSNVCC
jgi:hypothetical protein